MTSFLWGLFLGVSLCLWVAESRRFLRSCRRQVIRRAEDRRQADGFIDRVRAELDKGRVTRDPGDERMDDDGFPSVPRLDWASPRTRETDWN
jgi:hypothetical protein